MKTEWLASLKVGDPVAIEGNLTVSICRVHRLTATKIVIQHKNAAGDSYDVRFRRDDGFACGTDQWHISRLCSPEEPHIVRALADRRLAKLRKAIADALPKCVTEDSLKVALAAITQVETKDAAP